MKIKEVYNSNIAKILGVGGITIYPFIFYSDKEPNISLRYHEWCHIYQVKQLGWFYFYFDYLFQYLKLRIKGKDHFDAYWYISYEVEARDAEWSISTTTLENQKEKLQDIINAV